MSISSILISDSKIFAGTYEDGIYCSANGGEGWTSVNSGLNSSMINVVNVSSNGFLFAGTIGGGIYRSSEPVTNAEDIGNETPSIFLLKQNFPNPFNPSTKINFSIPHSGKVVIKVYDILGNEIETLVNEFTQAGNYEIEFNASNLPSGVYFYRIISDNFIKTRKMILLR